jgi:hypothetical protein
MKRSGQDQRDVHAEYSHRQRQPRRANVPRYPSPEPKAVAPTTETPRPSTSDWIVTARTIDDEIRRAGEPGVLGLVRWIERVGMRQGLRSLSEIGEQPKRDGREPPMTELLASKSHAFGTVGQSATSSTGEHSRIDGGTAYTRGGGDNRQVEMVANRVCKSCRRTRANDETRK